MNLLRHWFANPTALGLLLLLPALGTFVLLALRRRRRGLALLASLSALEGLARVRPGWRRLRGFCLALGMVCLVLGIAGPQWGREPGQVVSQGRDLVVVLDMSWSMQARDALPSRLGRACEALRDLADTVQKRGGHRLALVAFASRARVVCPLTYDHDHFRDVVRSLEIDGPPPELWPGPNEETVSGTRIGAGLEKALELLDARFRGAQEVLMISDGDDPARDDEWRQPALAARDLDIPVHVVGVGDPEAFSKVPSQYGFLEQNGKEVLTRLEEGPLLEIKELTRGTYTPAHTSALPLGRLFEERIATGALREAGADPLPVYRPRYVWCFAPALVFLAAAMAIPDAPAARKTPGEAARPKESQP